MVGEDNYGPLKSLKYIRLGPDLQSVKETSHVITLVVLI